MTVIATPNPNKRLNVTRSYRPIPLLCVAFKIRERLIYTCTEPTIDAKLPQEQAGLRHGSSTVGKVVLPNTLPASLF